MAEFHEVRALGTLSPPLVSPIMDRDLAIVLLVDPTKFIENVLMQVPKIPFTPLRIANRYLPPKHLDLPPTLEFKFCALIVGRPHPHKYTYLARLIWPLQSRQDPVTYTDHFNEISHYNVHLNIAEKLWAAWYAYMQNDVLATGIMSFGMHEIVYFGRAIPFMVADKLPYFKKYKIQAQKMPTLAEQWACARLVLLSHFTVELPQIWLFHPMAQYFGLQTSVPFPPIWKMLYQIAIFFVLEDAWHYWFHRALHTPTLYKKVHKLHHQYSAPFGLAAEYASPIETMVLAFGTVGIPIIYCAFTQDLHILTMYLWIVGRLFQAIDAHSGYEFPWSMHHFVPFWAGADHHDVHHEKFMGNYSSSFRWWDKLCDTEAGSVTAQKKRQKTVDVKKVK